VLAVSDIVVCALEVAVVPEEIEVTTYGAAGLLKVKYEPTPARPTTTKTRATISIFRRREVELNGPDPIANKYKVHHVFLVFCYRHHRTVSLAVIYHNW